jgi:hypothetical protein
MTDVQPSSDFGTFVDMNTPENDDQFIEDEMNNLECIPEQPKSQIPIHPGTETIHEYGM